MPVKPIPDGYHTVTPYLIVRDAAKAIDFYKRAFGASELFRMADPRGKVGHAEIKIGDSVIMMADECPEREILSPESLGGAAVSILLYVEDVNKRFPLAIAAGGTEVRPLQNQFYGDRSGTLKDPFGHAWTIATHVEDVAHEEMMRRMGVGAKKGS